MGTTWCGVGERGNKMTRARRGPRTTPFPIGHEKAHSIGCPPPGGRDGAGRGSRQPMSSRPACLCQTSTHSYLLPRFLSVAMSASPFVHPAHLTPAFLSRSISFSPFVQSPHSSSHSFIEPFIHSFILSIHSVSRAPPLQPSPPPGTPLG